MALKLYHVYRGKKSRKPIKPDEFIEFVCAAISKEEARKLHPSGYKWDFPDSTWPEKPEHLTVDCIGEANPDIDRGVIVATFEGG